MSALHSHDIIVVGTSAGGIHALKSLVAGLPASIPAAVFVVQHFPEDIHSSLPDILARSGPLPARHAREGDRIDRGHVYVAPPGFHMLLRPDRVSLSRGPKENRHRPAIDPLFRSAAYAYGPRTIGVVLTGALDDGTAGLVAIKKRGGLAVVQDPDRALYSSMPRNALAFVEADRVVSLEALGRTLGELALLPALGEAPDDPPSDEHMNDEIEVAELDMEAIENDARPGVPSQFTCPDCHGSLWEIKDGVLVRYRCCVGHAFSPDSLMATQEESIESALYAAMRALEERAALARALADDARARQSETVARTFDEKADESSRHASVLRDVLVTAVPSKGTM